MRITTTPLGSTKPKKQTIKVGTPMTGMSIQKVELLPEDFQQKGLIEYLVESVSTRMKSRTEAGR